MPMSNRAVSLVGSEYGMVPVLVNPAQDFTMMFWARFDEAQTDQVCILFWFNVGASPLFSRYVEVYAFNDAPFTQQICLFDGNNDLPSGFEPAVGEWFHVAVVWVESSKQLHLVINGVEVGFTTELAGLDPTIDTVFIGDASGGGIQDSSWRSLKMFDVAMTEMQIQAEMAVPELVASADIIHWYDLNGPSDLDDQIESDPQYAFVPAFEWFDTTGPTAYPSEDLTQCAGFFGIGY